MRTFTTSLALLLMFVIATAPVALAKSSGFTQGASVSDLRSEYEDGDIKILIAAGHEPGYGGAVYQGVYEREIVSEVADQLADYLKDNPNYEVIVTRDNDEWNSSLDRYFDKKWKSIESFVKKQKKEMAKLVKKGDVESPEAGAHVEHAAAPTDVALRLYGINKWANENDVDLVINLHVNDAPDHGPNEPSKYTGYAVYVPDSAYGNSKTSIALARDITDRLEALSDVSTLPGESAGVVPDQELIAIGANGTLNIPSVLIEYGYITEPRFVEPQHRETLTRDLAYQTYLAIQDFFNDPVEDPRSVTKLPTMWPAPVVATTTVTTTLPVATTSPVITTPVVGATTSPITVPPKSATTTAATTTPATATTGACAAFTKALTRDITGMEGEVRQLQAILAKDKTLYPEGIVNGFFGPATERAVQAFQKKNGIVSSGTAATTGYGAVGPKTAKALLATCTP